MPSETDLGSTALDAAENHTPDLVEGADNTGLVEDRELAHDLANGENSQRTFEQMAQNLESSGLPQQQIEELQETLRTKGQELADKATEEYEKAQEKFVEARDEIVGKIISASEGHLMGKGALLVEFRYDDAGPDRGFTDITGLTSYQQEQLKIMALSMLGAKEPVMPEMKYASEAQLLAGDSTFVGSEITLDTSFGFKACIFLTQSRENLGSNVVDYANKVGSMQILLFPAGTNPDDLNEDAEYWYGYRFIK